MVTQAKHALHQCLPLLRADLRGIIDSNTAWTLAALGKPAECLPAKLDCIRAAVSTDRGAEELREEIAPVLAAIRAAEAVVGRIQAADDPAWLDRVIDGEAGI